MTQLNLKVFTTQRGNAGSTSQTQHLRLELTDENNKWDCACLIASWLTHILSLSQLIPVRYGAEWSWVPAREARTEPPRWLFFLPTTVHWSSWALNEGRLWESTVRKSRNMLNHLTHHPICSLKILLPTGREERKWSRLQHCRDESLQIPYSLVTTTTSGERWNSQSFHLQQAIKI